MGRMTPDDILEIASSGETFTVEFKQGMRPRDLNDSMIVQAVACLANGAGGLVLLGVEDSGKISGLAPRHGDRTDPNLLRSMILNRTEPPVATSVDVVGVRGLDVAVIDVPRASSPVGTSDGIFVRRTTGGDGRPACVPYRAHEIISTGMSTHGRDYAETIVPDLTRDHLDPVEIDRFREFCRTGRGDRTLAGATDDEVLRALRLLQPGTGLLAIGAVLLFGRPEALTDFVPTAEVIVQEEQGASLVLDEGFRLPLLRAAERIAVLIEARQREQEVLIGLHRVRVSRFPNAIVREAVANALVHRDYSELGPIAVRLDDSQLRVSSPGGFPPGITLHNLVDDSRPRSVILAEAFKRAGLVDRAGRGVATINDVLLRSGRAGADYTASNDATVIVSVPTTDADLEMVRFVVEHEDRTGTSLPMRQLWILQTLKTLGPAPATDLAVATSQTDAAVRGALTRLAEEGLVEARGNGRSRRFHLSTAFYRAADAEKYVRLLELDPIQQGQMVMSYVQTWGSITRGKAAELCRLTPQHARAILKRLVDEGQLELRGERRGARYVLPSGAPLLPPSVP